MEAHSAFFRDPRLCLRHPRPPTSCIHIRMHTGAHRHRHMHSHMHTRTHAFMQRCHGTGRQGTGWHGTGRHGTARYGAAQHGTVWHGMTRRGTARLMAGWGYLVPLSTVRTVVWPLGQRTVSLPVLCGPSLSCCQLDCCAWNACAERTTACLRHDESAPAVRVSLAPDALSYYNTIMILLLMLHRCRQEL